MSWKPNIQTQNIISTFIEDLLDFLPEQLGIEEIISGCEVISLDPQGLGLATFPRPILCRINEYYQLVQYRGGLPALAVGDFLTVLHLREGNRYEVLGMGGSGGAAPFPGFPCQVAVWRGCTLTEYADPDDAFTNANVAGDVILVPEGTWTLSASHTMANSTSIVGIGGDYRTCILQAVASTGADNLITTGSNCVVYNVRISYTSAVPFSDRRALYITSTSLALLVDTYAQEGDNSYPVGIYVDGGQIDLCTAYAVNTGNGAPTGITLTSTADAYRCEGRALGTSVGNSIGIYMSSGTNTARWCRGDGQDIVANSYGIYSATGTNYIYWCEADGETTDIYIYSGTLYIFLCQYDSIDDRGGAGTIAYMSGDRDVMDLDGDTYMRALDTDDQIDIYVAGNPWGTLTATALALDDGVGDSPRINWVGGSNNDTGYIFLEDDAVALNSDIVVGIPGPDADARVIFRSTTPADVAWIDGGGNIHAEGNFEMVATTATVGQITQAGTRVFHTYGTNNIFIGAGAGNVTLTGTDNLCMGVNNGPTLTTGSFNMLFGGTSGYALTTGNNNVAVGRGALEDLISGDGNMAIGSASLRDITTTNDNVAVGYQAMRDSIGASAKDNVAIGSSAGRSVTLNQNVFIGGGAGLLATTIWGSVIIGFSSASALTTGDNNILIGGNVADNLTTGGSNIIIGYDVDPTGAAASNELNIGDALYGDLSTGFIGVGTPTPATLLELEDIETLTGNVADDYAAALTLDPGYTGAFTVTRHNYIDVQDVSLAGGAAVTNAAVMRFDAGFGVHLALAAAFNTTDTNADTTAWAGGVIINVNGTLYKVPAIAI